MTVLKLLAPDATPFFLYGENAVSAQEARGLVEFFASIPERIADEVDPATEFVFATHSTESGRHSRAEAAAGDPIWLSTDWGRGVAIPQELLFLQERVRQVAESIDFDSLLGFLPNLSFTSTYVDRYRPGGGFSPHTDGDRYGAVIAGVSIGPGRANFALWPDLPDGSLPEVELTIEPNSVYFFCGPIRHRPWLHAVREVTDLRYGITWRTTPRSS